MPYFFYDNVNLPKDLTHVHTLDPNGISSILGGIELVEFQARTNEIAWLNGNLQINSEQKDTITRRIWADISSQLPLRISDRYFNVRNYDSWVASFYMADIALNGEWPLPDVKLLSKIDWEDLHPGWRFYKICEYIKENKIPVPKSSEIEEFQFNICKKLGWPEPHEAMRTMIASLEYSPQKDINKIFIGLIKKACEYLKRNGRIYHGDLIKLNKSFSSYFRGPVARPNDLKLDESGYLSDVYLQLFFGDMVLCPICFQYSHKSSCPLKNSIENLLKYNTSHESNN